ncbi:hypothetical protein [Gordonia sp. OPL2]|uniref:hypothetical protein n=1 Tax=Gordonia sp. OPL2 TaxID=2486274 RepID=UPI0016559460|nr:hypothetical protein [Gordonia sp. OPL2]ROZ88069.1 hypothetical protein EEB19_22270 [Gordonia sp. OPL2]
MIATKSASRTLWGLTAALCLALSLTASAGRAEAVTTYCYGDDSMCWSIGASGTEAVFEGEVDITRGPFPGLYFDTAKMMVKWKVDSFGDEVRVDTAFIELTLNETYNRRAFFSHQIREWVNNQNVSYDQQTVYNEPGDKHYAADYGEMHSELGNPVRQYAEMDFNLDLATPGLNTWHFRVRSPVLENIGHPYQFNDAEDLPIEPVTYGWIF